jgi:hypothetical protein
VRQHPFFDRYTDSCTQTLRVVTYIPPRGDIEVLSMVMKISVAGRFVDNLGQVGMTAAVSPEGVMGPGVRDAPEGRLLYFDKHPETAAPISGVSLPGFDQAVALAIHAQSLVPQLRSAGWDIAITADGPVLIEGNSYWGWYMMQRGRRQGVFTGTLAAEMREILSRSGVC